MKIDQKTGRILGYIQSSHAHHVLNVAASGDVLTGARPDIVLRIAGVLAGFSPFRTCTNVGRAESEA
jgi:hypothetical protein